MSENEENTAVETVEETPEVKERIELTVEITDAGPCRKHLKVRVPRPEVDKFFNREFSDLVKNAAVPGFRAGKTPRRLIERKFKKEVSNQVKANLLMQTLEQIGEEQKIEPLSEPDIKVDAIQLPDDGDFVYEFEVEVRPEFDVPEYKGLKINKPAKEFAKEDIDSGLQNFLRRYGNMTAKDGLVENGDYVVVDVRFMNDGAVVNEAEDLSVRVDEELFFRDGKIAKFGSNVIGRKAGDSVELKAILSDAVSREDLRGKEVDAIFVVKEVKTLNLPELNAEFFEKVGVSDEGELRDLIKVNLDNRLKHDQKQSAIDQVMEKIVEAANWQLPPDLLRRQAQRTLQRVVVDLQEAGYSEEEISAKINTLRQNSLASTAKSLKQQFVLQAIAEKEEIKVEQDDLEEEIRSIAMRSGESQRRVRARVEKEGLWDALALNILEQKTVDKILSYAETQEVPYHPEETKGSSMDESAIPEEEVAEESAVEGTPEGGA